jgi:hypothetical protein
MSNRTRKRKRNQKANPKQRTIPKIKRNNNQPKNNNRHSKRNLSLRKFLKNLIFCDFFIWAWNAPIALTHCPAQHTNAIIIAEYASSHNFQMPIK